MVPEWLATISAPPSLGHVLDAVHLDAEPLLVERAQDGMQDVVGELAVEPEVVDLVRALEPPPQEPKRASNVLLAGKGRPGAAVVRLAVGVQRDHLGVAHVAAPPMVVTGAGCLRSVPRQHPAERVRPQERVERLARRVARGTNPRRSVILLVSTPLPYLRYSICSEVKSMYPKRRTRSRATEASGVGSGRLTRPARAMACESISTPSPATL